MFVLHIARRRCELDLSFVQEGDVSDDGFEFCARRRCE